MGVPTTHANRKCDITILKKEEFSLNVSVLRVNDDHLIPLARRFGIWMIFGLPEIFTLVNVYVNALFFPHDVESTVTIPINIFTFCSSLELRSAQVVSSLAFR